MHSRSTAVSAAFALLGNKCSAPGVPRGETGAQKAITREVFGQGLLHQPTHAGRPADTFS